MRATEMHDLLQAAHKALIEAGVFVKGQWPGFPEIDYCRHCHYSQGHGHGADCIILRLERATTVE